MTLVKLVSLYPSLCLAVRTGGLGVLVLLCGAHVDACGMVCKFEREVEDVGVGEQEMYIVKYISSHKEGNTCVASIT